MTGLRPMRTHAALCMAIPGPRRAYDAALALAYGLLRALSELPRSAQILPDSSDYLGNAQAPLNFAFFVFPKPAGAALIDKLLGGDLARIVTLQTVLSIVSWLALAAALTGLLRTPTLRLAAFPAVLLAGCCADVLAQTAVILTESLSISFFVLTLAALLILLQKPSLAAGLAFVLLAVFWGLIKESNGLMLGATAVLLGLGGLLARRRAHLLAAALALFCAFLLFQGFSNLGDRWRFPLLNVIAQRVLTDPQKLDFFATQGMPVTPALLKLTGQWGYSNDHAFVNAAELRDFQEWLARSGKATFYRYLLAHPASTLSDPLRHLGQMLSPADNPLAPAAALLWLPLLLVSLQRLLQIPREALHWFCLAFLLLVYAQFFVAWNGDAMEIERHALSARMHLNLAICLSLLILTDIWLADGRPNLRLSPAEFWRTLRACLPPAGDILARGLILAGGFSAISALLLDLIRARGMAGFAYLWGRGQTLGVAAGLALLLLGLAAHARRPTLVSAE